LSGRADGADIVPGAEDALWRYHERYSGPIMIGPVMHQSAGPGKGRDGEVNLLKDGR